MQNRKFFVALLAIIVLFLGVFTFAQTTGNNEEEKIIDENEIIKKEKIKEGAKENLEGQSGENNLDQPEENSQTLLTPNRVQIQVDVTAPIITIADYIKTPTNQTIVVTATTNEGTLNQTTYTFIENGSFTFIATDAAGNKSEKEIVINNIDKVAPKGTITYDNLELTNKDVIATLTTDEEATITNNEGSNIYTFTENGVFEFTFIDAAGNEGTVTAVVDNIDKVSPKGTITYDNLELTNKDVVATLTIDEEATITNNEGSNTYTFTENGVFEFAFIDAAGNIGTATAEVDNIDKVLPKFDLKTGYHTTEDIKINVTEVNLKNINVYNQDMKTNKLLENGAILTEEATYKVTATDNAGNKTDLWVAIDRTNPEITGVINNGFYNEDIEITVYDKFLTTVTLNDVNQSPIKVIGKNNEGKELKVLVSEEGTYTVVGIDKVGNQTTMSFTIDKTAPEAPTLTSPLNEAIIKGDIITNSWSIVPDAIKYMYESYRNESATTLRHKQTINAPNYSKTATNISNDTFWWRVKSVDQAGNESLWSDLWKVTVDNTKPITTLNGDSEIFVEFGTEYEELGAKVTDNVDEDLEAIITSNLDLTKLGTYTIKYNVTDTAGNIADEVTRTVVVRDTTAPIIILGNRSDHLKVYEAQTGTYNPTTDLLVKDLGSEDKTITIDSKCSTSPYNECYTIRFRAGDDGNLEIVPKYTSETSVDLSKVGKYRIDYYYRDQSGNSVYKYNFIFVQDTTKPVISLIGEPIINIEVNSTYTDAGSKVSDNCDSNLIAIVNSNVDTSLLGQYIVRYNVTDTAGNIADEVTRTVNVVDSTEPIITLNGGDMEIVLGESFTDPGVASVSDNYATLSLENVIKTGSVNVNIEGTYELNYSITDGFNTTNIKRKVIVKPLIKQLSVYNPNEETKYNGFNISFNRDFVVNDPSQIKIQYEYSIEGGSYVLANLVKYPGYVYSNPTYLQEEYNFFKDIIKIKTTTFYGMLNANGGKILTNYFETKFKADTIQKDVVVSMQEHNVQDRLRTAYNAVQSGKTVLIRTVLTFKLENGASVTYKLDPIKYN